jgi:transcription termination factor Rho
MHLKELEKKTPLTWSQWPRRWAPKARQRCASKTSRSRSPVQAEWRRDQGSGTIEVLNDGFGFLFARIQLSRGSDDIYVAPSIVRRFGLRTGDTVEGEPGPKEGERYFALTRASLRSISTIPIRVRHRVNFDNLTSLYPDENSSLTRST